MCLKNFIKIFTIALVLFCLPMAAKAASEGKHNPNYSNRSNTVTSKRNISVSKIDEIIESILLEDSGNPATTRARIKNAVTTQMQMDGKGGTERSAFWKAYAPTIDARIRIQQVKGSWQIAMLPDIVSYSVPPMLEVDVPSSNSRSNSSRLSLIHRSKDNTKFAFVGFECNFLDHDLGFSVGQPIDGTVAALESMRTTILKELSNDPYNRYFDISNVEIVKTNWGEAFFLQYKSQFNNDPVVLTYRYITFNRDKIYEITIAFRLIEAAYWCQKYYDIRQVINTMKFVKF